MWVEEMCVGCDVHKAYASIYPSIPTSVRERASQFKWRFFPLGFPEGSYEIKVRT